MDYRITCVGCDATDNLQMHAHRRPGDKKLVGWIFACPICIKTLRNAEITIRMEGEPAEDSEGRG